MSNHWLLFKHGRGVVGCHCGFESPESDDGWGLAVSDHLQEVGWDNGWEAGYADHLRWMRPGADDAATPNPHREECPGTGHRPPCSYCGEDGGDCGYVCC